MSKASQDFVCKCKTFWGQCDVNDDGDLTIQELAKLIRKVSKVDISDSDIAEIFVDIDDDGSKTLSWEEFQEVFTKKDPKSVQTSELKEAFAKMDTDGSGRLSCDEIKAQYKALGIQISDESLDEKIKAADCDGDGKMNVDEFLAVW